MAGSLLDELHARGQTELGVHVGEVGLHGALSRWLKIGAAQLGLEPPL